MKNKFYTLFSAFLLTGFIANAQLPNWAWASNASSNQSEDAASITSDGSGNTYVTGKFSAPTITFGTITLNNAGNNTNDIFVAKYNSAGQIQWAKAVGGTDSDLGLSIGSDAAGNTFVTGQFNSGSISFDGIVLNNLATPSGNIFVAKYDAAGNILWAKSYGYAGVSASYAIEVMTDGEYYLAGDFSGDSINIDSHVLMNTGTSTSDIFIAKFDSSGHASWVTQGTGAADERPYDLSLDQQGNCFVIGATKSITLTSGTVNIANTNISGASYDGFIIKFGPSGSAIWGRALGGLQDDYGYSISVSPIGYVYFTGTFSSTSMTIGGSTLSTIGAADIFMGSYDVIGNPIWGSDTGTAGVETAKGVVADINGNYGYFTGRLNGDIMVTKVDSIGTVIWTKITGDASALDNGNAICMDNVGDCIVAGSYGSASCDFDGTALTNAGLQDFFIAKLNTGLNAVCECGWTPAPLYPNPTSGKFYLSSYPEFNNLDVKIYDLTGKKVYSDIISGQEVPFDLSNLANGVYYLTLTNGSIQKNQKLIIAK
jgi:hypothetical protein